MTRSPSRRRLSIEPTTPDPISPREHSFVKTTFGKPVVCRVCLHSVKKSAVLCEQCSLIAHTKCAPNAPPTCDLRSQLLLYAQYAENGTPTSPYSTPLEILQAATAGTPTTPISEGGFSSRPSLDSPLTSHQSPSLSPSPHPPTAFKVFAAFKRSRSSLNTNESEVASITSSAPQGNQRVITHKRSILRRNPKSKERPASIASSNASPHSVSSRSVVTASSSVSSRPDTVRQSRISIVETDISVAERPDLRLSKMTSFSGLSTGGTEREGFPTSIPGEMPRDPPPQQKKRDSRSSKSSSNGGCVVQ